MTDKPTRTRKPKAVPPAEPAVDAVPAPDGAVEASPAPVKAKAPGKPKAAAKPKAPATAEASATAEAPAKAKAPAKAEATATASTGAKRPGLPAREPGQVRKRPGRKTTDPVGDGSIDPGEPDPAALAMARRIVELAEDKKASDIMLLDVRALTAVTDYFIICSGQSERQLGAVADGIAEGLKETGVLPIGREGGANAHWVLLDFGAAIVHVMAPPERDFYQLEKLWADATLLVHVQ